MKHFLLLTTLCWILNNEGASSQTDFPETKRKAIPSPYVMFSPKVAIQLFGAGNERSKGVLDCALILANDWPPYTNAQVTAPCTEAQVSCIRYGLIYQELQKGNDAQTTKDDFYFAQKEVRMKLRGCQLAIEGTLSNTNSLVEAAGYPQY